MLSLPNDFEINEHLTVGFLKSTVAGQEYLCVAIAAYWKILEKEYGNDAHFYGYGETLSVMNDKEYDVRVRMFNKQVRGKKFVFFCMYDVKRKHWYLIVLFVEKKTLVVFDSLRKDESWYKDDIDKLRQFLKVGIDDI